MKIFNWLHSYDFSTLLELLSHRDDEEDFVVHISKRSQANWYHIALLAKLYPQQRLIFVCRDPRLKTLLKQYGFISHSSIQNISDTIPESAHIIQENL